MKDVLRVALLASCLVGFFLTFMYLKHTEVYQYSRYPTERCRINKVIRIDDYQDRRSVYPTQIRWTLITDKGYKLYTRDGNYRVGDSVDVKIIKISNK